MTKIQLHLYSTAHCHLCEHAEALLMQVCQEQSQVIWESIEIADNPALEHYANKIPVLKRLDTNTEINWPFGELEIKKLLNLTLNIT